MKYLSMPNLFISTVFIVFCWNEAVPEKSVQANVDECDFYDTCYPVNPIEIEAIGRVSNLGGLYDSRSNQFISVSLFEQQLTNSSIISTSNKHTKLEYTVTDTLSEKFRIMDISGGLKVSILSGLIELQGSGRYFKDTKKSYKSAKASLIQSISTEYEEISITDKNIKTLVNMDVLEQIDATHVVVGIQWGGKVLISVEDTNSENIDKQEIDGNLAGKMKGLTMLCDVEGNLAVNITDDMKKELSKFSFEIFGDVLPTSVPTNLIEGIKMMKNAPSLVKDANNGKGKEIKYKLIPISLLRKLWKINTETNKIFKNIEEETIQRCVELFDNMNLIEQQLNDLLEDVKKLEPFIENIKVKQVKLLHLNYSLYQTKLRTVLSEQLFLVRSGNEITSKLEEIIFQTTNDPFSWENVAIKIDQLSDLKREISFLKLMTKLNITLFNKNNDFQQFLWENFKNDIYIFFYDYNQTDSLDKYMNQFRRMIESREEYGAEVLFAAANIDVFNKLISNETKISLYRNGACYMNHYELGSHTHNDTNDPQEWSLFDIQNKLSGQIKEVSVLKTQLNNVKNNPIPINFTYVQLSNQQEPKDIWPNVEWKDVTSEYNGLFFRAEGKDSAEFGKIQEDNGPRTTNVFNSWDYVKPTGAWYNNNLSLPIGSWSNYIYTGSIDGSHHYGLRFLTSGGEVRPRNMAMRIWKRIG